MPIMYWDHGHEGGWGWGGWLLMSLTLLFVLALLAWGAFLLWRSASQPGSARPDQPPAARQTPQEILAERLARGEIDGDEYRERLNALRSGDS
jgi:putative membrane protein